MLADKQYKNLPQEDGNSCENLDEVGANDDIAAKVIFFAGSKFPSKSRTNYADAMETKNASGLGFFVGLFFVLGISAAVLISKSSLARSDSIRYHLDEGNGAGYQSINITPLFNSNDSFSGDERLYKLFRENLQDRATTHLGDPTNGYVHINTHNNKVEQRRKQMAALDKVRVDYCGPITDEYLEARNQSNLGHPSTRWIGMRARNQKSTKGYKYDIRSQADPYKTFVYDYSPDTITYANKAKRNDPKSTFRSFCSAPHPELPDTTVSIERQGPFYSTGGLDWTRVMYVDDAANMRKFAMDHVVYVVGTFFATVSRSGRVINYPPLHIHHAHVHPYQRMDTRIHVENMPLGQINHHVMIQTHGDGGCKEEDGGSDCNLHQLPQGQGYRIVNTSGFNVNYEINDVRPEGSEPLEYFVDIVVMWTKKKLIETTFMQIGSPVFGGGWMTYMLPLDSNSNFAYWKHKNSWLGAGEISNFIMHTHMSLTDSLYVFKGNKAYNYLENYRHEKLKGRVPYVFDCHNRTMEKSKADILGVVVGSGAELVCEATRPSMQLFCDEKNECIYRDTRFDFNCKEKMRLEEEDELVVVAFNKIRNTSTVPLTRNSPTNTLLYVSTFGEGYVAHQHSFFRYDFVSDRARKGMMGKSSGDANKDFANKAYAPPALFLYSLFPNDYYNYSSSSSSEKDSSNGKIHGLTLSLGSKKRLKSETINLVAKMFHNPTMKNEMIKGCEGYSYDVNLPNYHPRD